MRKSLLTLAFGCLWLLGTLAYAQSGAETDTVDRPSQRWLPVPNEGGAGVAQQMRLIQKLNEWVKGDEDPQTPSKLSESQLKLLDRAVESLRNESGQLELPTWESIPKQLRDLADDPAQRRQAQRILEQYARERGLPLPGSNSSSVEAPTRQSPTADSGTRIGEAMPGGSTLSLPQTDRSTSERNVRERHVADGKSLPSTSANSRPSTAVQELFDKLKQIEKAQRAPRRVQGNDQRNNDQRNNDQRASNQRNNDQRNNYQRSARQLADQRRYQQAQSAQPGSSAKQGLRNRTSDPAIAEIKAWEYQQSQQFRDINRSEAQYPALNNGEPLVSDKNAGPLAQKNRDQVPSTNEAFEPGYGGQLGVKNTLEPRMDESDNPFSESFQLPKEPPNTAGPSGSGDSNRSNRTGDRYADSREGSQRADAELQADFQRQLSEGLKNLPQGYSQSRQNGQASSGGDGIDVRQSVATQGWERTLRRIVQKTLKDQDRDSSSPAGSAPSEQRARQSLFSGNEVIEKLSIRAQAAASSSRNAASRGGTEPPRGAASSETSGTNNSSWHNSSFHKQSEYFGRMLRSTWKAIADAPPAPTRPNSSGAAAAANQQPLNPSFQWDGRTVRIIGAFLVFIAGMVWLARRRLIELALPAASQSEWAKSILAEGLRTRADVVRAYHRFVLQTSQPVAAWWTHRYAAKRLSAATPQLAVAVDELTLAYEHARYMPPEYELSAEQLERVDLALRKCDALSV